MQLRGRNIIYYFSIVAVTMLVISCANIQMPTGGPNDNTPPRIKKSTPNVLETNFSKNEISILFDEFVEIKDPLNTIILSPPIHSKLKTKIVGKKIKIVIDEPLQKNKTYSLQLMDAIKDFREGNLMQPMSFSFSTGEKIDSSKFTILTYRTDGKSNSDLTKIALVKEKSDFFGNNFSYYNFTQNGIATITNLDNSQYWVYTFIDSNKNNKWDKSEIIGFSQEKTNRDSISEQLYLFYQESKEEVFVDESTSDLITASSKKPIQSLSSGEPFEQLSANRFIVFTEKDSFDMYLNGTIVKVKKNKQANDKIELLSASSRFSVVSPDSFSLELNQKIKFIDISKISVSINDTIDSAVYFTYKDNKVKINNLNPGASYKTTIDTGAIKYANTENKATITSSFTTLDSSKMFGPVTISFDTTKQENVIIRPVFSRNLKTLKAFNDRIEISETIDAKIVFEIFEDLNNNGLWDTGDVYKSRLPEKIKRETISLTKEKKEYELKLSF